VFSSIKHFVTSGLITLTICTATAEAQNAIPELAQTNEEVALMVLANAFRGNPNYFGEVNQLPRNPLRWNTQLATASLSHADDMAANPNCYQHNSCNGQSMGARISSYYGSYVHLSENIDKFPMIGTTTEEIDPFFHHISFINSSVHKANILSGSAQEFGAGLAVGFHSKVNAIVVENFGSKTSAANLRNIPVIPGGAVVPRVTTSNVMRDFIVNYYDYTGAAPQVVRARLGNSCIDLENANEADPFRATYGARRGIPGNGCIPLVFEAIQSNGRQVLYPPSGSILVGVGASAASCAYLSTTLPTADCGDGPLEEDDNENPPASASITPVSSVQHKAKTATITINFTAKDKDGNPASKVKISAVFDKPVGANVTKSATTNAAGKAKVTLASISRQKAAGVYKITITGTKDKLPFASAATDVTVKGIGQ